MTNRCRVVWSEGLFLQPQHFQQQERYIEALIHARSRAALGWYWGFERLAIDQAGLDQGRFGLQQGRGVFPDGTAFEFPGTAQVPAALVVPPDARNEVVVLAVPLIRPGIADMALDGAAPDVALRYQPAVLDLADRTEGQLVAPVQVGVLRPRLMLARDAGEGFAVLPLAQIVERDATQRVVLDATFIPPTLSLRDQPLLLGFLREAVGLLQQRGEALAAAMGQPGSSGVGEIADFLMLMTLNRSAPLLAQLVDDPALHPVEFHRLLLMLAGELATFTRDNRRPGPYPVYVHDDPRATFVPLMNDLRRSLSTVMERSAIQLEVQDRKHGVHLVVVPDRELFRSAGFVLSIGAQLPSEVVRTRFPTQVKVGPPERLRDLVNLQLPGIGMRPLPVAPRQLPYHAGRNYFELDRDAELWKGLENSGALAMHIAGEFPGLEVDCWAIRL